MYKVVFRHIHKTLVSVTGVAILILSITGCLQESDGSTKTASTPSSGTLVNLGFSGVNAVENMDGSTIRISWLPASSPSVVGYRVYEVSADGTYSPIQQLDSSATSYRHTGLVLGSTHTYLVKAINGEGNQDTNTVVKSAFTFGGITLASVAGLNSVTVYFTSSSAFAGIKVYYKAARSGSWLVAGTTSNSASSYTVTGLNSGTTYDFKVTAYTDSGAEDTNPSIQSAQTYSLSFNPPAPLVAKYKGFILVQAFGAANGAPSPPTSREVKLVWEAFSTSLLVSTSYVVVRVASGGTLDMATTVPCTTTTTTSCRVCTVTGILNQSCTDNMVGAPPVVYDYAVSMTATTNWPEELPSGSNNSQYRTKVSIPPDNMILVHRDSVNYEMCKLMGKNPDPLNKQRCAIVGASMLAAIPYNSTPGATALGLSPSYYDFGYDLFVDRWETGCNWTPVGGTYPGQVLNGMCGASNTPGDCYGTANPPTTTIGVEGNVYYNTSTATCYYRTSGAWVAANTSTLTTAQRLAMSTNDPSAQGGYRPPLAAISQSNSNSICNSNVDSNYGTKRLLRKREFVAAAAWPSFQGEPNQMDLTMVGNMESSASTNPHILSGGYQCNTSNHKAISAGAFKTTKIAGDLTDSIRSFVIGSIETSNCISRFGAQDMTGNVWEWNSDQLYCNITGSPIASPYALPAYSCLGLPSSIDSGNGYSSGYDMNGFLFNGTQGPGGVSTGDWTLTAMSNGAVNFSFSIGVPLVGTDYGNAVSIATHSTKFQGNQISLSTGSGSNSRGLYSGGNWNGGANNGRWTASWVPSQTSTGTSSGFRCALPAE